MTEPEQNQQPVEPAPPDDATAKLQAQCDLSTEALAAANAKADEYLVGWKRAMADYANLQKEVARQREEMSRYACVSLVGDLLPALDGFRDAAAHAPKPAENGAYEVRAVSQWMEGLAHVRSRLEAVLKSAGVQPIDETGVPFDPAYHEAVTMEKPADPAQSGQVLKVLQAGYRMHDRVLRAAKVVVAE